MDHPRVCGEKKMIDEIWQCKRGSPPRMRGKEVCKKVNPISTRITPAYAGKSVHLQAAYACREDHPRVCGEKLSSLISVCSILGSPPRMRGKAAHRAQAVPAEGITPAYAGKRRAGVRACSAPRDHPRVCGEKPTMKNTYHTAKGSPPRMRGKVSFLHRRFLHCRITPAYAGKSRFANSAVLLP